MIKTDDLKDKLIEEYEQRIIRLQEDIIDYPDDGELGLYKVKIRAMMNREEFILMALKQLGCGCGLCLVHNGMVCPKMPGTQTPVDYGTISTTTNSEQDVVILKKER